MKKIYEVKLTRINLANTEAEHANFDNKQSAQCYYNKLAQKMESDYIIVQKTKTQLCIKKRDVVLLLKIFIRNIYDKTDNVKDIKDIVL